MSDSDSSDPLLDYFMTDGAGTYACLLAHAELLARLRVLQGAADPPITESALSEAREELEAMADSAFEEISRQAAEERSPEDVSLVLDDILANQRTILEATARLLARLSGRDAEAHLEALQERHDQHLQAVRDTARPSSEEDDSSLGGSSLDRE